MDNFILYLQNEGRQSQSAEADVLFQNIIPADYLYANFYDKSLRCLISEQSLHFQTEGKRIQKDDIDYIKISHHFSFDELHIVLNNGLKVMVKAENAKLLVNYNMEQYEYALCKLDYIKIGKTI